MRVSGLDLLVIGLFAVGAYYQILDYIAAEKEEIDSAYHAGYSKGRSIGYDAVYQVYADQIKEKQAEYAKELAVQKNEWDKKIEKSSREGFAEGKKSQLKETEAQIQKKAKQSTQKGNWDDVLYTVKE